MSLEADRSRLLEILRTLSFERRKVVLASGRESDFYIDCKRTALTAEGHVLVGRLLFDRVRRIRPLVRGVGGLTLGADPIASAVALTSFLEGEPVDAYIVRKEPKGHGTGQWIEGRKTIPDGSRVVVLEDVVTTGGSALKAIERCRAERLEPVACLALVDRAEGGREAIEAQLLSPRSATIRALPAVSPDTIGLMPSLRMMRRHCPSAWTWLSTVLIPASLAPRGAINWWWIGKNHSPTMNRPEAGSR